MYETLRLSELGSDERDNMAADITVTVMGYITIIFVIYFIRTEYLQFTSCRSKMDYFMSLWNWADIISLLLTLFIAVVILAQFTFLSMESLRILASFACLLLPIKIYD